MRTQATSLHISENLSLFGISSNISRIKKEIKWTIDPLDELLNLDNIRKVFISETSRFSSSSHRALRSSIASLSSFPNLSVFHLSMDNYKDYALLSSPRDIRFVEAPICLLLDIFARVISTNEIARIKLKNKISGIKYIPEMFLFHFKSTRISSCGTFRIIPDLNKSKNFKALENIPYLTETFFNYDWILSDAGISFISTVLSLISNSENNYINMVKYEHSTIPVFESGNSTTLTGMFMSYIDHKYTKISLLAGNTIDLTSKTLGLMVFINSINRPIYLDGSSQLNIEGTPTFEIDVDDQFYSTVITSSYCDFSDEISNISESVPKRRIHSKFKVANNFNLEDQNSKPYIKHSSETFPKDNSNTSYKQKE